MSKTGRGWGVLLALLCCAVLLLTPDFAAARAGASFGSRPSSVGSRGLRSWENNGAQPLNRPSPSPPQRGVRPAFGGSGYRGSAARAHPFAAGLAGGLIGSWLFGHSGSAQDTGRSTGSGVAPVLWLVLIGALAWFVVRRLRRRGASSERPGAAAGSAMRLRSAGAAMPGGHGRDVNFADADLQSFQQLHAAIQAAWSAGDVSRLRPLMTPQMFAYFSDQLAHDVARGVRNIVSDVHLLKGELSESWEEAARQYATAYLRWRAIDYLVRRGASADRPAEIVAGDPRVPVETEEVWTFSRSFGGNWILSAIQQV
ncbi:MAG: Tim44 domain-containing protein [Stellaceae bacterium]